METTSITTLVLRGGSVKAGGAGFESAQRVCADGTKVVSAASLPALAKNARTGHPRFRIGRRKPGARSECPIGLMGSVPALHSSVENLVKGLDDPLFLQASHSQREIKFVFVVLYPSECDILDLE